MIGKRAAQKGGGEAHRRMGSTVRRRPRPWRRSAEEESPEVGIAAADESREERRRERERETLGLVTRVMMAASKRKDAGPNLAFLEFRRNASHTGQDKEKVDSAHHRKEINPGVP